MNKGIHKYWQIVAAGLLLILATARPTLAQWSAGTNISNTAGTYCGDSGSVIDSNGKIHAVWIDWSGTTKTLYYATNASGSWVKTTVGTSGWYFYDTFVTLAIDSVNTLHLFTTEKQNGTDF